MRACVCVFLVRYFFFFSFFLLCYIVCVLHTFSRNSITLSAYNDLPFFFLSSFLSFFLWNTYTCSLRMLTMRYGAETESRTLKTILSVCFIYVFIFKPAAACVCVCARRTKQRDDYGINAKSNEVEHLHNNINSMKFINTLHANEKERKV